MGLLARCISSIGYGLLGSIRPFASCESIYIYTKCLDEINFRCLHALEEASPVSVCHPHSLKRILDLL